MVSVYFGEQIQLHCMNVQRQDAKTRGRIDGPQPNTPDVTKLHRKFPAGMDLLERLRRGSSFPSQLKAVPHFLFPVLLSPP